MRKTLPLRRLSDYGEKYEVLGLGVSLYKSKETGGRKLFAIKEFGSFQSHESIILHEISCMMTLPASPYIMPLIDVVTKYDKDSDLYSLYLVMPNGKGSLYSLLNFNKINMNKFLKYIYQLVTSLAQVHQNDVWHCDIKIANYIYFDATDDIVLGDFGASRLKTCSDNIDYDRNIYTFNYSPIEFLLGYDKRDLAGDVWALGCSLCEIMLGRTLFDGKDDDELAENIFQILGSPPPGSILTRLPLYSPSAERHDEKLTEMLKKSSLYNQDIASLIMQMLNYDYEKRITAFEARNMLISSFRESLYEEFLSDLENISIEQWTCYDRAKHNFPYDVYNDEIIKTIDMVKRKKYIDQLLELAPLHQKKETYFLALYILDQTMIKKIDTKIHVSSVCDHISVVYSENASRETDIPYELEILSTINWNLNISSVYDFFSNIYAKETSNLVVYSRNIEDVLCIGYQILLTLSGDEIYFTDPEKLAKDVFDVSFHVYRHKKFPEGYIKKIFYKNNKSNNIIQ